MKKVLIYGDSNTWGDNFITGVRIADDSQWPNVLQKELGNEYKIIQEGLPGRIAGSEDVKKYKNGKDCFISIFRTSAPVDIVIIALGTNDLQIKYDKSASIIINDLISYNEVLMEHFSNVDDRRKYFIEGKFPRVIYILPSNFDYINNAKEVFDSYSEDKRQEIIKYFFNSNYEFIVLNDMELFEDGVHFNNSDHLKMAIEVKNKILK